MKFVKRRHTAFNQKPSYRATPRDWTQAGGHAHSSAAHRFLNDLSRYRLELIASRGGEPISNAWLLPFRNDFRRMMFDETARVLRSFMLYGDPALRHVTIWLLSRFADRFRLLGIDQFSEDPSPMVRKHVAKALRRLEAWPLLGKMITAYPTEDKIFWFAKAPIRKRPFRETLHNYSKTVDHSRVDEVSTPSQMPFWAQEVTWERTPPKSVFLIRRMLRRIRHWVRWGMSS